MRVEPMFIHALTAKGFSLPVVDRFGPLVCGILIVQLRQNDSIGYTMLALLCPT